MKGILGLGKDGKLRNVVRENKVERDGLIGKNSWRGLSYSALFSF